MKRSYYGWMKGRHISKKSRFLVIGITMSSSSFSNGVPRTEFDDDSFAIAALPHQNQIGNKPPALPPERRDRGFHSPYKGGLPRAIACESNGRRDRWTDKSSGGVVDRTARIQKGSAAPTTGRWGQRRWTDLILGRGVFGVVGRLRNASHSVSVDYKHVVLGSLSFLSAGVAVVAVENSGCESCQAIRSFNSRKLKYVIPSNFFPPTTGNEK
ncbi:hypothetical protein B296_00030055 [Ensete ventricosum]|uniref:Uncharacterized protein n=1 Tax=Ensete ventricosum TaxID=4639 RepID=A0A426XAE0_ENSVE|nr:hypothetical protein B296_00030055 [Ensete ventricosum]